MSEAPGWEPFRQGLARQLAELHDGGFVVLTVPSRSRDAVGRRSALFGLIPPKIESVAPFVQLLRSEEALRAECIGPTSLGGRFPYTAAEQEQMPGLGWHATVADGMGGPVWVHFFPDDVPTAPYLPRELADAAAALAVTTLREVFGCVTPDLVEPTTQRDG